MSIGRSATEWLSTRAIAEIDTGGFAQADIDELFDVPPADPVHVGLEFLRAARDGVQASHPGIVAMLVVPLPASDVLVLRAPDFTEFALAAWEYGPGLEAVGLYLLEQRMLAAHEPIEEHRCHVDASDVLGSGPSVYFGSWRTRF
ncbi:MAG: hypothetical protein WAW85_06670 [Gordonia sp. (in: high G+C Gram-positive bacteria)]|uniref:hypothetical protein n=1 Tax=Gordonia sp. (in: high G+C Gram-positive bacteria) TaxID=84139 RepID=UPI003BB5E2E6